MNNSNQYIGNPMPYPYGISYYQNGSIYSQWMSLNGKPYNYQPNDITFRCNLFSNCTNTVTSNYIFDYDSDKNINDIKQLKTIVDNNIDITKEIFVVIVDDLNSIPSLHLLALVSVCAEYKRSLVIYKINDNRASDCLNILFYRS